MKAYFNYFKLMLITHFQYRSAAIAGIFTQVFFGFVYILVYTAFYESNTAVNTPLDWAGLATYIWLGQAFFSLIYPMYIDHELLNTIKNGNVAYELIRPQNLFFKYYFKTIAKKLSHVLLRFPAVIMLGFALPASYGLSLPHSLLNFVIFVAALISSLLLCSAYSIIAHLIAFYSIDARGITTFFGVVADIFMGGVVPLPFFPKVLKTIAYALPFRYIADFPFRVYSNDITILEGLKLLGYSSIWIIIFILIGYIISKTIAKKVVVLGG